MTQTRIKGPARRERLLDAAAQIVLDQGVAAVTMDGVAVRNGVNRAIAYRYFADREDLLAALLDREYHRQTGLIAEGLGPDATFEQWLRYAMQHWFQHGDLFMRLYNDHGPLAVKAKAIRQADAEVWAVRMQQAFGLPPRTALHLASFMVAGATGAMETRNGTDDAAIISNIVLSIVTAAQALRGASLSDSKIPRSEARTRK
jgi:AcrR family transcriptional regulator